MARGTLATAFEHPLGSPKGLTPAFIPYHRIVPPILFVLAFVCDFAGFGAAEVQMRCPTSSASDYFVVDGRTQHQGPEKVDT